MAAPAPIDPRGPRFNQAVLALALGAGWAADLRGIVPLFAVVLLLGAAFGPRYGPFLRLYADVVRPRLRPPAELEDPRPPRFAAAVGVLFLSAAIVAFAVDAVGLGWALALVVAGLAGLAATTGICVGCEVYVWAARLAAVRRPAHTWTGAERTWLVFTTPYCASCGPVAERLRTEGPSTPVVTVDAMRERTLAAAYRIRSAPTALLVGPAGDVQQRLVGPAAVERYVQAGGSTSAERRGLARSRADSTGPDTPQSAAMSGSSQATPSSSAGS